MRLTRKSASPISPFIYALLLYIPIHVTFAQSQVPLQSPAEQHTAESKRIAVIGAGAAGTSFTYHLSQSLPDDAVEITLFEATDRIGGRAMNRDISGVGVEMGASIFLKENQLLYNATQKFNLSLTTLVRKNSDSDSDRPPFGIWNGNDFSFVAALDPYRTIVKMLWRYGWAPLTVRRLARAVADQFGFGSYDTDFSNVPHPKTVSELVRVLGLEDYANITARDFLIGVHNVNGKYVDEFVEAATRVNYAQNLDLNALAMLVCMAAANGETVSVEGGNQKIFEGWVAESGAKVRLETRVTEVEKRGDGGYMVKTKKGEEVFDAVVIAVPWSTKTPPVTLHSLPSPPHIPYRHLHVTIISGTLSPAYFQTPSPPIQILTLNNPSLPFFSLSTLYTSPNLTIHKIFSPSSLPSSTLAQLFTTIDNVVRHEWDAYPVLPPRNLEREDISIRLDDGVWFLNGFEGVFSTMESQSVVGRIVAANVVGWVGAESGKKAEKVGSDRFERDL